MRRRTYLRQAAPARRLDLERLESREVTNLLWLAADLFPGSLQLLSPVSEIASPDLPRKLKKSSWESLADVGQTEMAFSKSIAEPTRLKLELSQGDKSVSDRGRSPTIEKTAGLPPLAVDWTLDVFPDQPLARPALQAFEDLPPVNKDGGVTSHDFTVSSRIAAPSAVRSPAPTQTSDVASAALAPTSGTTVSTGADDASAFAQPVDPDPDQCGSGGGAYPAGAGEGSCTCGPR
jgi:hypothetical protein